MNKPTFSGRRQAAFDAYVDAVGLPKHISYPVAEAIYSIGFQDGYMAHAGVFDDEDEDE